MTSHELMGGKLQVYQRGNSRFWQCAASRLFRRLFLDELRAAFEARHLGFFGDLTGLAEPAAFARRVKSLPSVTPPKRSTSY
jgi:hypothetical protein